VIRVGIVDDHPVVVSGLRADLDGRDGIVVAWVAASVAAARVHLATDVEPVDVVLVDVLLPDGRGFDLLPGSLDGRPRFIVMSGVDLPHYGATASRRGAAGFIDKATPTTQFVEAIRTVVGGGTVFDVKHAETIREGIGLTPREAEIVQLVGRSYTNHRVAGTLGISIKTVEAHLRNIFRRHRFASRTQLALWAERRLLLGGDGEGNGLPDEPPGG